MQAHPQKHIPKSKKNVLKFVKIKPFPHICAPFSHTTLLYSQEIGIRVFG